MTVIPTIAPKIKLVLCDILLNNGLIHSAKGFSI